MVEQQAAPSGSRRVFDIAGLSWKYNGHSGGISSPRLKRGVDEGVVDTARAGGTYERGKAAERTTDPDKPDSAGCSGLRPALHQPRALAEETPDASCWLFVHGLHHPRPPVIIPLGSSSQRWGGPLFLPALSSFVSDDDCEADQVLSPCPHWAASSKILICRQYLVADDGESL